MIYDSLRSQRVFSIFEQLAGIPHGSGNMKQIASFCEDFAKEHNLKYIRDDADNIIIFKNGTTGYENSEPIILQGHLDMVCQKAPDCNIDFKKDGLDLYIDGDFLKARGTTLGADNGIAVAMVLAILESNDIPHPPIEAVFTIDEEIGMIGALALDTSVLNGLKMINLDSETEGSVTVSCAGGSDFRVTVPFCKQTKSGTLVNLDIHGLQGGHSGVEIDKNRVNANMITGRILNDLGKLFPLNIVDINGGDKPNAIPNRCVVNLCTEQPESFCAAAQSICDKIKDEISDRESAFEVSIESKKVSEYSCLTDEIRDKLIYTLLCVPNGITEMSAGIKGLVQTSLNLGVLMTNDDIVMHFALRSNKMSALEFLEKRLSVFFDMIGFSYKTFGHYPAWEYREISKLRDIYCDLYKQSLGKEPKIVACHAGLECGVFASKIKNFDCISIGPSLFDAHTVRERLSISSTINLYNLLLKILKELK